MNPATTHTGAGGKPQTHTESIRDTLISVVIAFALAFVFRGFVIEAFVIPTGSMAPTLMGAHMRFRGPNTGYLWPVGPWDRTGGPDYASVQPPGGGALQVHDPISGEQLSPTNVPLRSGDRILVLKYLYSVQEPSRYDVVVFKNPTDPGVNYIKRLVGLPGEEIALVDGDVFARPASHPPDDPSKNLWAQPSWKIARKRRSEQVAVWQTVFDSAYAPLDDPGKAGPWNTSDKAGWDFSRGEYRFAPSASGAGAGGGVQTELYFDKTRRHFAGMPSSLPGGPRMELWSLDDRYPYDQTPTGGPAAGAGFPVSDVRMRAGIEPRGEGLRIEATVRARGMDFQAVLEGSTGTLRKRALLGEAGIAAAWETLGTGPISPLASGRVTDVEFWHADQALQLWVGGKLVARHEYEWTPAERIAAATGMDLEQALESSPNDPNALRNGELYRKRAADVRWRFGNAGAGFSMHRVGIDRDLHYQAAASVPRGAGGGRTGPAEAALATSPRAPLRLSEDQIFCCGDNSPQSLDGRLWGDPEPWVSYEFGNAPGVVPRDLLLGKAFFVYWPAPHWNTIPIPDFGRMRFIR